MAGKNSGNMFLGGPSSVTLDGVDVGYSSGGVKLSREVDWYDFVTDQTKLIVKKQPTMAKMRMELGILQPELEYIRIAWSMPSSALVSASLQLVEPAGTTNEEITAVLVGPTIDGSTSRNYRFARCVAMADGEYNLSRETPSMMPITFDVLSEGTSPDRFGAIWDV